MTCLIIGFTSPTRFVLTSIKVVMDTELYIVGKDVAELKISKKFRFEKISSDFKMSISLYGLELGVKANLKTLSPRSQFQLWAQTELTLTDMTNKMKFHSLQLTSHAPTVPRIYGTLSAKLSGAVPVLCETVYEGFLNVMAEYDTGPGMGLFTEYNHNIIIPNNNKTEVISLDQNGFLFGFRSKMHI